MLAKRVLGFFLLFTLTGFTAAQTRNRTNGDINAQQYLRGKVKLHNEQPVANARVELRRMTGEVMGLVVTNDDGLFSFSMVPSGAYVLTITCEGYETIRETLDLRVLDLHTHEIYLHRAREPRDAPAGPTVSVRELSLPSKAANAYRKGTEMLYQKHNVQASIAQFQEAVKHYSDYYEAYFQLGVAYSQARQLDEAVAAFEKSLQLSAHRYAPPLIGLAAIANERRNFQEAAGLAQRGVDLDPELWQGHLELGRAMLGLNKLDAAEKSLHNARTRNSAWPALHLLFANLHIRQNDPRAVRADLEEYLRLAPSGAQSQHAREVLTQVTAILAQSQPAPAPRK